MKLDKYNTHQSDTFSELKASHNPHNNVNQP